MRKLPLLKLPLLLVLLLLSLMLLTAAASAKAADLPPVGNPTAIFAAPADEEEAADEEGEDEEAEAGEEGEDCGAEEDELCEEEGEDEAAEECLLEEADAAVVAVPGKGLVRLTVRYRAFEPIAVLIDAGLRGGRGGLHLGSVRARFGRAGTYRDSFALGPRQMPKALAAREVSVDLRALGTPAACALDLAAPAPHRAR